MLVLRIIAVIHALSLMGGEAFRSWGADRPIAFVVDDFWVASLLLLGAYLVRSPSPQRRALFAAGWGANAGMLYGSFFAKLTAPEETNPGNFDIDVLTYLVGPRLPDISARYVGEHRTARYIPNSAASELIEKD